MKKLILSLSAILLLTLNVIAQPTYTSSDFGVVGDSLFYTKVTLSPSQTYYFFQAGTSQTWNYSTFTPTTQYSQSYLSPLTAGYRPTFVAECVGAGGTAAACRNQFNTLTNLALPVNNNVTISSYTFTNVISHDNLTANALEANIIGMTARVNGVNVPFTYTYTTPDVVYAFPLAYGNRDSSVSGYDISLTAQGINFVYHVHSKRVNHDDAWGSITTPYTTYPSTVRQRSAIHHFDTLFYNGSVIPVAPYTSVVYSWFDPAHKGPVFVVHGTIGANGQENYDQLDYLDTIHCLTPSAASHFNPGLPTINGTGNVTVNFTNASANANSYTWLFGDPGSGAQNTSASANSSHVYGTAGTYNCELIACNTVCQPTICDTERFTVRVVDSGQVHAAFVAIPSLTCTGDSVHFHDNSTNATSYSWNFGDNTTSTLQNPSHIYSASGVFNVVLVAHGAGGTTDTARRTVTIQAPATATITPNGPTSFCNGDSVRLAATGGTVYHWSDGRVSATITVRTSGTYTVTAENTCGTAVSTPITVTVTTPVDTITTTGSTTICSGDSVTLRANTGTGLTYQWKRNGQVIINATQSIYQAKTSGNYTVNVTQNGCRGISNVIAVTVNQTPNATISVQSSTTICSGDSLRLTAANNLNNTYQWLLNGTNITGATSNVYYAKTSGTYSVMVSRNSCAATSNGIAVTVNPTPAPTISISAANTLCQGDSLQLTTQSGIGYTYQWKLNGNNVNGATSEVLFAKNQGAYTVSVTAQGCSGVSLPQSVIVHPRPSANAGQGVTHSLVACSFSSTAIGGSPSASGGTLPYQYLWTPASGLSSTTASNPTVSHIGASTLYTLLVTDSNGCSASDTTTVHVSGSSLSVSVTPVGGISWCYGTPDSAVLNAVATGGTGSYIFNWTPASYLSSTSSAHTVATPTAVGTYTYSVLATDGNGCQAGASVTVSVNPLPVATITANDTTAPCQGDSTHFTAGAGAGYGYQWLSTGAPISGATYINFAAGFGGSYAVSVTDGSCSAVSLPVGVTIRPKPSVGLTPQGSLTFCTGSGVVLAATSGSGYSYQWYENGQSIPGANNIQYTAFDSGTYYVQAILNGCTSSSTSVTTTVNPYPADSIAASGNTTFCAGSTVQISASTGNGYTYIWQNNGVNIPMQNASTLIVDSSGTYDVIVTAGVCSSTSLGIPVTVYQYPNTNVTASGSTTFCGGDSVSLSVSTGAGYTYQWQNDGNDIVGAVSPQITATDSGQYTVIVTNNGCTAVSNDLYVDVIPLPAAFAYISGTGVFCPGDSFYLFVNADPGSAYQWQLAGSNITGATTDTIYTHTPGTYDVLVTNGGCIGVSNLIVAANYTTHTPTITQGGVFMTASSGLGYQWYADSTLIPGATQQSYDPPAFSGIFRVYVVDSNGCGSMSAPYAYTKPFGISTLSTATQVSVYPNPAHESISVAVQTTAACSLTISLYDMIGNELGVGFSGEQPSGSAVHQLSLAGVASGVYMVRVSDGISTVVRRISVQ